jgi:hypothetical protein
VTEIVFAKNPMPAVINRKRLVAATDISGSAVAMPPGERHSLLSSRGFGKFGDNAPVADNIVFGIDLTIAKPKAKPPATLQSDTPVSHGSSGNAIGSTIAVAAVEKQSSQGNSGSSIAVAAAAGQFPSSILSIPSILQRAHKAEGASSPSAPSNVTSSMLNAANKFLQFRKASTAPPVFSPPDVTARCDK